MPSGTAVSGTTFTIGLLAFAITNGSPLAAWSASRDKYGLASWMSILRMDSDLTKGIWSTDC